jgi:hypothetical protein
MLIAGIFSSLYATYLRGAATGFGNVRAVASGKRIAIGNFAALSIFKMDNRSAGFEVSNFIDLENQLKALGPEAIKQFRAKAKFIGEPARNAIERAFHNINGFGPLGPPKARATAHRSGNLRTYDRMSTSDRGHLSWINARTMGANKAIQLNYKNRNAQKDFFKIRQGQDGALSIVRVKITAPAYIVADMAGKSNRARKGTGELSREYQINLFGRGVVTRRHKVNEDNVDNWIRALNSSASAKQKSSPSRYAWPTMLKYQPRHREKASKLLNETITMLNQRMQS